VIRIGLVADTHCPEFAERLPASLFDALDGVEAILHAGDVNARSTLEDLSRIAPVEAVRGDHDRTLADLPWVRELTIAGKRIVLVHGQRARWIEEPQTLMWTLTLGWYRPHRGLPRSLRRRFPEADVIVYGHTHRADVRHVGGALVINPGGVHQWNAETTRRRLAQRPGWFEWCWLQVAKHLVHVETPSVAVLEIDGERLMPRIVRL
jgi:putative phosphoesterase